MSLQAADTAHAGPGVTGMWEVAVGLVLVVALILVAAWLMRRVVPGVAAGASAIRVLAAMPLGPRERLLLVDAGGRQLLLGVTAQQINTLHSFDEPPLLPAPAGTGGEFATKLRELLSTGARS